MKSTRITIEFDGDDSQTIAFNLCDSLTDRLHKGETVNITFDNPAVSGNIIFEAKGNRNTIINHFGASIRNL